MTVVMLANREAFSAYLGSNQPYAVGGIYDRDTNDLHIFDNRAAGPRPRGRAEEHVSS